MIALGTEFSIGAWFVLGDGASRANAEIQCRIGMDRARRIDKLIFGRRPRFTVRAAGDEGAPPVPEAWFRVTGEVRFLVMEAVVAGHADTMLEPSRRFGFVADLDEEGYATLARITRAAAPRPLTDDEVDAAIETMGPDIMRRRLAPGSRI